MKASGSAFLNVSGYLDRRLLESPEQLAVVVPDLGNPTVGAESLTYGDLGLIVDKWRTVLAAKGVRKGTRVLVMVRMGVPLIALNFALLGMGAVPVVIDPGMGLRSFLNCVRRTRPDALVGIPMAHWIARVFWAAFRSAQIRVVVEAGGVRVPAGNRILTERESIGPDDTAAVLFTSGSTGPAKGVVYTHGMFAAQVDLVRETYGIEPGEIDFPMLPIFSLFDPALGMVTVVPPMNPSRPAKADPAKVVAAMRDWKVTNAFGSPVLWGNLVRECETSGGRLPDMRRILIAGAPVGVRVLEGLTQVAPNARIETPYGATECLPVATIEAGRILGETGPLTAVGAGTCVGRAVTGVSIRVMRPTDEPIVKMGDFVPCDTGEAGEIVVTGPTVTREYDGLPEATAAAKVRDEEGMIWHRMGDIGYLDAAGDLWFCGRKAERVSDRGGKILDTDRCEAIFNRLDGVFRTALVVDGDGVASLVVEADGGAIPRGLEREKIIGAINDCRTAFPDLLGGIERLYFAKAFPVDVRHNAKIHRRSLGRAVKDPIVLRPGVAGTTG